MAGRWPGLGLIMKKLLLILVLLPWALHAATPSFSSFNPHQFASNNLVLSLTNGVTVTNLLNAGTLVVSDGTGNETDINSSTVQTLGYFLTGGGGLMTDGAGGILEQGPINFNSTMTGNGGALTNLSGANIQGGTINSNRLDAATLLAFKTQVTNDTSKLPLSATNSVLYTNDSRATSLSGNGSYSGSNTFTGGGSINWLNNDTNGFYPIVWRYWQGAPNLVAWNESVNSQVYAGGAYWDHIHIAGFNLSYGGGALNGLPASGESWEDGYVEGDGMHTEHHWFAIGTNSLPSTNRQIRVMSSQINATNPVQYSAIQFNYQNFLIGNSNSAYSAITNAGGAIDQGFYAWSSSGTNINIGDGGKSPKQWLTLNPAQGVLFPVGNGTFTWVTNGTLLFGLGASGGSIRMKQTNDTVRLNTVLQIEAGIRTPEIQFDAFGGTNTTCYINSNSIGGPATMTYTIQPPVTANGLLSPLNGVNATGGLTNSGLFVTGSGKLQTRIAGPGSINQGQIDSTITMGGGGNESAVYWGITTAGSSGVAIGLREVFGPGFIGGENEAAFFFNQNAGTGTSFVNKAADIAAYGESSGTSAGYKIAVLGIAANGKQNAAVIGRADTAGAAKLNLGGWFHTANSGAGGTNLSLLVTDGTMPGAVNYPTNSTAIIDVMTTGKNALTIYAGTTVPNAFITGAGLASFTNGVASYRTNLNAPVAFTFPNTTVNYTNPLNCNVTIMIDNSAVTGTAIKVNGTTVFTSITGDATLMLQPGEYFSETYTIGTPTGTYKPF